MVDAEETVATGADAQESALVQASLAGLSRLDQLAQPALGPGSGVLVNQLLAGGLIDSLGGNAKFGLGLVGISRRNRLAYASDLRPNPALQGAVVESTLGILTKSFFGAGSVGHVLAGSSPSGRIGGEGEWFRAE